MIANRDLETVSAAMAEHADQLLGVTPVGMPHHVGDSFIDRQHEGIGRLVVRAEFAARLPDHQADQPEQARVTGDPDFNLRDHPCAPTGGAPLSGKAHSITAPLVCLQRVAASRTRRVAFDILLRVERGRAHADTLLHSRPVQSLLTGERAFVTEAVLGCLRRQGEIDHLISQVASRSPGRMDPEVLVALRMGAYQLRFMRNIPDHAAVSQSVDLVKRARKGSAAALANAVLRHLPAAPEDSEAAVLNHPGWLVRRWRSRLGASACERLLDANLRRPQTYFRIPAPVDQGAVLARLEHAGLKAEPAGIPRAFRLVRGSAPAAAAAAGRALAFRDLNSQRVACLLSRRARSPVLDVCAAPGGKARQLAESGLVVAGDRRLARMRTLRRLGSEGLETVVMDAERPLPFQRRFKRVLIDAPCSGTGTLARNPEIKWRLRTSDLRDLQGRQERILENSLSALAPGGLAVYATCSLEPEENEDVVRAAIARRSGWSARRALATVPGTDPGDGFQAWTIRRPAAD